jgi:hypothetical protein
LGNQPYTQGTHKLLLLHPGHTGHPGYLWSCAFWSEHLLPHGNVDQNANLGSPVCTFPTNSADPNKSRGNTYPGPREKKSRGNDRRGEVMLRWRENSSEHVGGGGLETERMWRGLGRENRGGQTGEDINLSGFQRKCK